MKKLGLVLLIVGVLLTGYFFLIYDTTVSDLADIPGMEEQVQQGGGQVQRHLDIGRMQTHRDGIIIGLVILVGGAVITYHERNSKVKNERKDNASDAPGA
jgi:hypothetical protein